VRAQNNPSTVKKENSQSLEIGLSQGTGVAYAERPNRDQVVLSLNPGLGERGEFEPSSVKPIGMRCRIKCNEEDFDNVSSRYRFMFTSLDERARALDRHLLKLQEQLCAFASIPDGELHPVGVPSQDTVWVCGRICCEAAEGRINKSSVVLEGSRRDSAGRRVHLDLQEVPAYSLFPGQIVLVEGVNSSGRRMVAKRIVEGIARPPLASPASKLLEYHHSTLYQGGSALNLVTAAGPFTTSDNLNYQPLQDLLVKVLQSKPDVLVLNGPFVDITQPLLSTGDVVLPNTDENGDPTGESHSASYEMVFVEKVVRDCLKSLYDSESDFGVSPTHIVLVPSLQDAHHEFVFPQPPFGDRDYLKTEYFEEPLGVLDVPFAKDGDLKKRVHLMPNPCMFRYALYFPFTCILFS
jgi:DNA polymerase alpha subunit B